MYKRVLTIVDGSPVSEYAIGASITIAREIGCTLKFCLTLDPLLRAGVPGMTPFAELALEIQERTLRAAIAQTEKAGLLGATGVIVSDDPARGAVAAARAENADLILMGIVPRIGILRPFVRNLVEGVLALSTTPLCAVRRPTRGFLTHRILVPIVFDALGKLAVDAAIGIAQQFKSTLVFCSIATGSDRRSALAAVEDGLKAATACGVRAETLVFDETGHIPAAIVRDADIHGCDAIVIATHARQGLPRIVEGSVTQALIEQCDVPVVVVRSPLL
jgi:nucleotide-binding universal stress UspA family protein